MPLEPPVPSIEELSDVTGRDPAALRAAAAAAGSVLGHPTGKPPADRRRIENRFWEKVEYGTCDPDECWEWTAATRQGYGVFRLGDSTINAHRLAYELTNGIRPGESDAEHIRHHCHNRRCCNPAHLAPGTAADNIRDDATDYRTVLTPGDVRELRDRYAETGVTQSQLADEYSTSQQHISRAIRGEQYAWVE
jgi:hypothetical protein